MQGCSGLQVAARSDMWSRDPKPRTWVWGELPTVHFCCVYNPVFNLFLASGIAAGVSGCFLLTAVWAAAFRPRGQFLLNLTCWFILRSCRIQVCFCISGEHIFLCWQPPVSRLDPSSCAASSSPGNWRFHSQLIISVFKIKSWFPPSL